LTALDDLIYIFCREMPTAALALPRQMNFNIVRLLNTLERLAFMPCLAAIDSFPVFGQTWLDGLFLVAVAARRLVAVCAVQTQTMAQLGVLRFKPLILFFKLLDKRF
jgi:hypothetical protein